MQEQRGKCRLGNDSHWRRQRDVWKTLATTLAGSCGFVPVLRCLAGDFSGKVTHPVKREESDWRFSGRRGLEVQGEESRVWTLCAMEAECEEVGREQDGSGWGLGLVRGGGKEIVV